MSTITKVGIDALDFLNEILQENPDIQDYEDIVIVWDPPYLVNGFGNWKKAHGGDLMKLGEGAMLVTDHIKLVEQTLIKLFPQAIWIKFHTNINEINTKEKLFVWYKSDVPESNLIGNIEFIELSNQVGKGSRIPFKSKVFEIPREPNTRSMCKPSKLYRKLFNLINPKFVLDLFAGYGNSIKVCKSMGITIFACDIDLKLEPIWEGHLLQQSLEEAFQ